MTKQDCGDGFDKWLKENFAQIDKDLKAHGIDQPCEVEGPKVTLGVDTTAKGRTPTIIEVPPDPVKMAYKHYVLAAKLKQAECRALTKKFLAEMKKIGCTGVNCSMPKMESVCGKRVYSSYAAAPATCSTGTCPFAGSS
jgi:hypothetical protein